MPRNPSNPSRRSVLGMLGAVLATPFVPSLLWSVYDRPFRIRTITAGISMSSPEDLEPLVEAIAFLGNARSRFFDAGYEVQTIRVATEPLAEYLPDWPTTGTIQRIIGIDEVAAELKAISFDNPFLTDCVVMPLA